MQPQIVLSTRPGEASSAGVGFLVRMRAWFVAAAAAAMDRRPGAAKGRRHVEGCMPAMARASGLFGSAANSENSGRAMSMPDAGQEGGAVVPFPCHGKVRLVQYAQDLKRRFADLGLEEHEPLLLEVSGGLAPRLWIDSVAYIEFRGSQLGYRVILENAFETRITLETPDFDAVAQFVDHYVVAKLTESHDAGGSR